MTSSRLKLDHSICRHVFDDAVVYTARLAAFSTSRSLGAIGYGEYYSISSDLCKKDLLLASISIRKLAEITQTSSFLKAISIKIVDEEQSNEKGQTASSAWDIIGNIIHGVEIELIKNTAMFLFARTDPLRAMESKEEIDAVVIIKSDKFPRKLFQLNDLLIALNKFTEEADEKLTDNGIYISSSYR